MQGLPGRSIIRIVIAALVLALVCQGALPAAVRAATFVIANGDVNGLIAAITTANGNGQENTITLATGGTYTLTAVNNGVAGDENGLPVIASSGHTLTINGNGATITRGSGTPNFRFFTVNSGTTLVLNNLTLANGKIVGPDGSRTGTLAGADAKGGAIKNSGTVTATSVTFSGNSAIGGNSATTVAGVGGAGGNGFGGAIGNTGTLTIATSIFSGNGATGGNNTGTGHSGCCASQNGGYGYGGAIRNTGGLAVSGSTFANNSTMGGIGGLRSSADPGSTGGFAHGGAISVVSSVSSSVTTSTFSGNTATGGTGGAASIGGGVGGVASGGAIDTFSSTLTVTRSTFTGDHATGGAGGVGGHDAQFFGQSAGGTGAGGAISTYDCGAALTVANSTFTGEVATGGTGGSGGTGTPGNGGNANGGAIGNNGVPGSSCGNTLTVLNATIAANQAVAGSGASPGTAAGGGVVLGNGTLNITNTLLSSNIAAPATANCAGPIPFEDHGHNLEFNPGNTCGFTGGKNDQFGDPKLDSALRDNGNPPQTLALLTGSAAVGNGDPAICAAAPVDGIDQRGFPRSPTQCAIGAFEPQTGAPSPTITAINPTSGPATGGSRVTITGTGFQSGLTIRFGGPTGPTATIISVSSMQIVLTTPAHAAGTVDVVVTNPDGGMVTRVGVYTYGIIYPEPPLRSGPPPSGGLPLPGPHARPGPPPSGGPPPAPAPSPRI